MANLILNYEGFENYLVGGSSKMNGIQYRFKFDNNYGASVVKFYGSYGYEDDLWELAVLEYSRDGSGDYGLTYDTVITSDVEGYLTDEDVRSLLGRIKAL